MLRKINEEKILRKELKNIRGMDKGLRTSMRFWLLSENKREYWIMMRSFGSKDLRPYSMHKLSSVRIRIE